jgi:hypothetical protein
MPADIDDHERHLLLRETGQLRTDIANLEAGQEFLMQRVNALPTASDLWRLASLIGLIGGVVGIVGIEWLWTRTVINPISTGRAGAPFKAD